MSFGGRSSLGRYLGIVVLAWVFGWSDAVKAQTSTGGSNGSEIVNLFLKDSKKEDDPYELILRAQFGEKRLGPEIEISPDALRFTEDSKLVCSVSCLYDIDDYTEILGCGSEVRLRLGEEGWGTVGLGCFGSCDLENTGQGFDAYIQARYRLTLADIGYRSETLLGGLFSSIGIEPSISCGTDGEFDMAITLSLGSLF